MVILAIEEDCAFIRSSYGEWTEARNHLPVTRQNGAVLRLENISIVRPFARAGSGFYFLAKLVQRPQICLLKRTHLQVCTTSGILCSSLNTTVLRGLFPTVPRKIV